ncbi:glycoside hydrolase N-terminal domain-containing protein [Thalassobellus suaedae]|uniref:Glycoside hydrolase family 95 protein n=1 Tax=Thalassobellus suaedae TaxID=3074124 RepID=A0ABY9XU27_9FLAO|nr:glycoside hydrolase family 95 protein [Flavobacteriaceae bacterium HL-DH14]
MKLKLKKYVFCSLIAILGIQTVSSQSSHVLKLWYDEPAEIWNEALPLGNGRLGAMVFGDPAIERLQLNEETIWAGSPNSIAHDKALKALPKVRQLIFDGKYAEAQAMATSDIRSQTNNGMPYQTFGSVYVSFPGHQNYTNYYRDLDIENATAKVKYTLNGIEYTREILTAFSDDVIVVKLSANKPGAITCNVFMNSPFDKTKTTTEDNEVTLSGVTSTVEGQKGRVKFQGRMAARHVGGEISVKNGIISIDKANEVTLYISIATNFKNYKDITEDYVAKSKSFLDKAIDKNFETIKKAHVDYYQKFFNRVSLNLGTTAVSKATTDVRIQKFDSQFDPELASLYFQFGRYLLISCSQPGGQPANLQGIWNDMLFPPWESKYTMNINAEMNYWYQQN